MNSTLPIVNEEETNPQRLATLVANHRHWLAFLERRVHDAALAEDLLQAAFVKSTEKVGQLKSDEALKPWFYRMLRNAVADHFRRQAATSRQLETLRRELDQPQNEGLDAEVCQCIAELATTLKPEYQRALARIEIDGTSVKDFAAEAGLTANNAGVLVFRARQALKGRVQAACGSCAEHGCLDCHCKEAACR